MINPPFTEVRNFVAIARAGSFTSAGLALGMTGSALSKSVMRLEARLGVKLLHRTTRKVSLTHEGDVYLASCQHALAILEEAETNLLTGQQIPSGRVRIDMPVAFGRRYVLPVLIELAARHERLDLSVSFSERKVNLVADDIDLAVRIGALEEDADLVARRLGEQRLVICGAPSYIVKHGMPLTREDLQQHDCIISWRRGQRHAWLLGSENGECELYDIPVRHEIADGEALLAAALAGGGLVQIPTWLAEEHLRAGTLVPVLSELSGGEMPIHIIWTKTSYLQPKLRVVVDELLLVAQVAGSGFRAIAPVATLP
ncbi:MULTISPECIES: LysR family transcriptional regulator [Pseudomonas]|uniref:LysR family transcriptional regulator n=1 Tax=Pseudomonas TaxID=286 RepID=UPI001BEA80E6|nr:MULTISPECIES: LysR family transcriptional regulator [Pseudomonas]MBT2338035.1 LysR family transcriptional regulator [Pseudomonas fluorescens]MCD4527511.1 LysR family transcriptional regulator [Pseudomonas sp. C3-2018]